jgi:hypothetical protein
MHKVLSRRLGITVAVSSIMVPALKLPMHEQGLSDNVHLSLYTINVCGAHQTFGALSLWRTLPTSCDSEDGSCSMAILRNQFLPM